MEYGTLNSDPRERRKIAHTDARWATANERQNISLATRQLKPLKEKKESERVFGQREIGARARGRDREREREMKRERERREEREREQRERERAKERERASGENFPRWKTTTNERMLPHTTDGTGSCGRRFW